MHVVYVTTDFVDNAGPTTGLPKYLLRVGLTLLKWGHEVSVVTCSNRTVAYSFYGIDVYRVRRPQIVKYGSQVKDTYAACQRDGHILNRALHELARKKKIDIIQYASLFGTAHCHDLPVPAVMRLSSYACMWPVRGRETAQNTFAEMERLASEKCDAVFGPSYVVADRFRRDIHRPVDVIETPFVMESGADDDTLYRALLDGKKYVFFYGTLVEYKGLGVIAQTVYDLLCRDRSLFFVLIGDGDTGLVDAVRAEAKEFSDRVIYHHAVGFPQLKPIIRNAQAVVLPSLMENFANACVESMALGQIVIGTEGVSFEQLITDGVSGFLCRPGDAGSLLHAICRALELPEEQKAAIREKARERTELLAPERVVRQLEAYYEQIIRQKRSEV